MATMLDCKKIQPLLSEYVDNALAPDTAWAVKLHVSSCAVCAQVSHELQATANLLSSLSAPEPSAGFDAALAARLAGRVLAPRRVSLWERLRNAVALPQMPVLRPAFIASTAALAALIPAVWFTTHNIAPTGNRPVATQATDKPAAALADANGLQSLWDEHSAYSSASPLGDQASVMLASDYGSAK